MGRGERSEFLRLLKTVNVPGSLGLGLWGALPNSFCWNYFSFLPLPFSSLFFFFSFLDGYSYGVLDFPPWNWAIPFLLWQMLVKHKSAICFFLPIHSCCRIVEEWRKALSKAFLFKRKTPQWSLLLLQVPSAAFTVESFSSPWFLPVSLRHLNLR